MTHVLGVSSVVLGEQAMAAEQPKRGLGGFLGGILSEIADTARDVAGTGIQSVSEWAKARLQAGLGTHQEPISTSPQVGAAPTSEEEQLTLGKNTLPIVVVGGGALVLGLAMLAKR